MGASTSCTSKEKGCSVFIVKQVKYNSSTCDLSNNFTGIEFEIEGLENYHEVEQYRLLLNATTNTNFIEFSEDSSGSNPSPHKIDLVGSIDPAITTTITVYVSKTQNASSSSRQVTIDCKFWHGEVVDPCSVCHHNLSIILLL